MTLYPQKSPNEFKFVLHPCPFISVKILYFINKKSLNDI